MPSYSYFTISANHNRVWNSNYVSEEILLKKVSIPCAVSTATEDTADFSIAINGVFFGRSKAVYDNGNFTNIEITGTAPIRGSFYITTFNLSENYSINFQSIFGDSYWVTKTATDGKELKCYRNITSWDVNFDLLDFDVTYKYWNMSEFPYMYSYFDYDNSFDWTNFKRKPWLMNSDVESGYPYQYAFDGDNSFDWTNAKRKPWLIDENAVIESGYPYLFTTDGENIKYNLYQKTADGFKRGICYIKTDNGLKPVKDFIIKSN